MQIIKRVRPQARKQQTLDSIRNAEHIFSGHGTIPSSQKYS